MTNRVYKVLELTGSSTTGSDDAVRAALAKAAESVRNMRWFQVQEVRGSIDEGAVTHWQVTIKVGFALED
ncbi:MAG: dodecin domain-containing protein [Lysobacterales bacterium]|jgi:flavin-binding protein dodecin|nr:MAG: dodecin domain-containing protein [Xanthomonadales bacterium]